MKFFYARYIAVLLFVTAITASTHVFAQHADSDQHHPRHRSAQWPKQVITQQNVPISPAQLVNFKQLADSQLAHPAPSRTGFIEQGEDKDAEFKFIPHKIPANTPVFDVNHLGGNNQHLANQVQHQANSPAPTGYFLGTTGNGNLIPPDVAGAAGPTYVMETNNQQFDIYTKTGTLHATLQIDNFFSASGGQNGSYFDPHILYDNIYNKFIVVIDGNINSNGDGGLFIGVSQTSDPNGNWWTYAIDDGDASQGDLLDYPELGYNNNWVVLTANDFVGANTTADIYVLSRASLYSGTLGTVKKFTDNNAFSWAPAQTYDTSEGTLWMVQEGNGGNGAMQIGSITGTVAAPVYSAGSNVAVTQKWNDNSVDVGQLGGGTSKLINDDDTRVGNGSVYINGKLWFTHAVWLPATGTATYAASDWWEITPSTLTVNQFGRIADPNGNTNYYYPSLNVNSNGDALLGYCVSGTDSFYPSAAYSFHAGSDPINTMQSRYIYKAGVATYYQTLGGGRNRYGDFTGTSVDPADQSFWNYSEWAYSTTIWGTVIAHVGASIPPTNPPVANFVASDTAFDCSGLVQFTDLSTNLPTSWLWTFGDGGTSTQQNPGHLYTTNGTYSVTLNATNTYGTGTATITSYITINLPAAPPVANVSHCGSSAFSLSASTTNSVGWFDSTGTLVSGSNPFVTPILTQTTTYWVQDTLANPVDSVGPATYTALGTGSIFTNTNQHYLTFDAYTSFTLISVVVDASTAGTRTIQLYNSGGTVIATATPNIPVGVSTVTLNFSVPAGTGYALALANNTTVNLYRNNGGGNNANTNYYPITLPGVVSITGSDAGAGYYYYFYNWKVQGGYCVSARTPVSAIVGAGSLTVTPTPTAVTCYGASTGSVSVAVSGGTPNYTYTWSNGQLSNPATNLPAGTYIVTITDAGGCSSTATASVVQPSSGITASVSVTDATCYGDSTGSVNVIPSGGTPNYTYNWGGGITTQNRTLVPAGTYTVSISDAKSCSVTASGVVGQPAAVVATATAINSGCGMATTGSAYVSVSGGSGLYHYLWSNSQTTDSISNLGGGTYSVTVADNRSCSATASATVTNAGSLALTTSATGTSCFGSADGTASVSATGSTGALTYAWSDSASTDTIINLTAGTYIVTVTDGSGCSTTQSQVITQPAAIQIAFSSTNAACGSSNGSIVANPSGGVSGYSYLWNTNATTDSVGGLAAGTYGVTVTDANTCTAASATSIANAASLVAAISSTNSTCHGAATGSATVTVTAGNSPYTYLWSNGGTANFISNLAAGTYIVTITDNLGCKSSDTAIVTQPNSVTIIINASQPACGGQTTGSASLSVSGGNSTYTYLWSNGATTNSVSGLTSGAYTVTVLDGNNCSSSAALTIASVPTLNAVAVTANDSCFGGQDGTAQVIPSGGASPYIYSWNNSAATASVSNLAAGTYSVTIIDANGCSGTATVNITQPAQLQVGISAVDATNGQFNGAATIDSITGGKSPYTVVGWSNGGSGNTIGNLAAGTYTVTVSDNNGCEQTASVTVKNVTGINDIAGGINFSIYPNPAKTDVVVDMQSITGAATISLKDILGQTMLSRPATSSQTTINLGLYADGVYFVEVTQGGKRAIRKLVISR